MAGVCVLWATLCMACTLAHTQADEVVKGIRPGVPVLSSSMIGKASLLFRQLDLNYDRVLSGNEIEKGTSRVQALFPSISLIELQNRVQTPISQRRFQNAVQAALKQSSPTESRTLSLLEVARAEAARADRSGFFWGKKKKKKKKTKKKKKKKKKKKITMINEQEDGPLTTETPGAHCGAGCIMCQYLVDRIDKAIKAAHLMPQGPTRPNRDSFRRRPEDGSFLQLSQAQVPLPPAILGGSPGYLSGGPYAPPVSPSVNNFGAGPMPLDLTQPGHNNYFDHLEMQLFVNMNHVADLTLDGLCESTMPNRFYQHCSVVMKLQHAIVHMIGRQFKILDTCYNVGMCNKYSYVWRMKHNGKPPKRKPIHGHEKYPKACKRDSYYTSCG